LVYEVSVNIAFCNVHEFVEHIDHFLSPIYAVTHYYAFHIGWVIVIVWVVEKRTVIISPIRFEEKGDTVLVA